MRWVFGIVACWLLVSGGAAWAAVTAGEGGVSRYTVILDRKPFGEPLPEPVTPPKSTAPPKRKGPPFTSRLQMCAITESDAGIRVGIVNNGSKPPKSYYMSPGDTEDGIELVDADYERGGALLRKGEEEHWVYIGGHSTDAADVPAPGNSRRQAPSAVPPPTSRSRPTRMSFAERLRRRREALQRQKDQQQAQEQAQAQPAKLEGKELEKHLQEYQMELIRQGKPPLPIPLTPEMDEQLVNEGVLPPTDDAAAK